MAKRPLFPPGISRMTDIADAMRELRAKKEIAESGTMKKLIVSGKVSDMCDYHVVDTDGNIILENDGYVPYNLGIGGGDYLSLEIDIETGTIVGWDAARIKERIQEYIDIDEQSS